MKHIFRRLARPLGGLLLVLAMVPFGGCEAYDPSWLVQVDSAALYSLARTEYIGRAGGYDFARSRTQGGGAVVVERADPANQFEFDFAVTEVGGEFVALPAGLFEGHDIQPGIKRDSTGVAFDEWELAPRDGYITDEPVPLETGALYAVRSRRNVFDGCTHYGKFEVLELDPDGVVRIQAVRNHLCNDRELIPPDDD